MTVDPRVWALSERNVLDWTRLDRSQAVLSGVTVPEPALTDHSTEGCQDRAALARATRNDAVRLVATRVIPAARKPVRDCGWSYGRAPAGHTAAVLLGPANFRELRSALA